MNEPDSSSFWHGVTCAIGVWFLLCALFAVAWAVCVGGEDSPDDE